MIERLFERPFLVTSHIKSTQKLNFTTDLRQLLKVNVDKIT